MSEAAANSPLLDVRELRTHFPIRRGILSRVVGHVKVVDGVSFQIHQGRTLGLVGESGCGKTTVGRSILRLIAASGGAVRYRGRDVLAMSAAEMRLLRRQMQIIFQDPLSSLNPRMSIGNIVGEPIHVHGIARGAAKDKLVAGLLERVGLDATCAGRYPHEFSGGQRQRIGIARALALNPEFIVCDEPVSALDVSIQSQVLNLLSDLQDERKIAYLFISHNLAVVEHFADEVAVMYLGRIVEKAPAAELYAHPAHPYTMALLSAVPGLAPRRKTNPHPNPLPAGEGEGAGRIVLRGEVPSPSNPPTGCAFHPRCPLSRQAAAAADAAETAEIRSGGETIHILKRCQCEPPPLEQKNGRPDHLAACWLT